MRKVCRDQNMTVKDCINPSYFRQLMLVSRVMYSANLHANIPQSDPFICGGMSYITIPITVTTNQHLSVDYPACCHSATQLPRNIMFGNVSEQLKMATIWSNRDQDLANDSCVKTYAKNETAMIRLICSFIAKKHRAQEIVGTQSKFWAWLVTDWGGFLSDSVAAAI